MTKIRFQTMAKYTFLEKIKTKDYEKKVCTLELYSWFSHDVTKIRTTKLLILLGFYFNDV